MRNDTTQFEDMDSLDEILSTALNFSDINKPSPLSETPTVRLHTTFFAQFTQVQPPELRQTKAAESVSTTHLSQEAEEMITSILKDIIQKRKETEHNEQNNQKRQSVQTQIAIPNTPPTQKAKPDCNVRMEALLDFFSDRYSPSKPNSRENDTNQEFKAANLDRIF